MHAHALLILLLIGSCLPYAGWSQTTPDASTSSALPTKSGRFHGYLGLSVPFVTEYFSEQPLDFSRKDLDPPYELTGRFLIRFTGEQRKFQVSLLIDPELAWTKHSAAPMYALASGVRLAYGSFWSEFEWQFADQSTINTSPYASSAFDTWWLAILARVGYGFTSWLEGALELKYIDIDESTLATYETLETKIAHKEVIFVAPTLWLSLPFAIKAMASAETYFFGGTAIASKEFGFGIPKNVLFRPVVGAGFSFSAFEIWLKGAFTLDYGDPEENFYRSVMLMQHYTAQKKTIFLEGKWKF